MIYQGKKTESAAIRFLRLSVGIAALASANVSNAKEVVQEQSQGSDASAQASSSSNSSGYADAGSIGDIVVTAQLKAQSVQKVPAAVSVLDDTLLVNRGATTLVQVSQLAPALRISPLRSQTFIFLRGVGQALSEPNADPQIAVNVNGVYVPSEMSNTAFFDVDRIEVVPGPQGTLYGRNAAGGVINLFTKRPGQEVAANGYAEVGNYGRVSGLVAASVPLTDALAIRAAATLTRHSGYYSNGMAEQETYGGRLTAVWQPDDATTITAIGTYVHDGGLPSPGQLSPPRTGDWWRIDYDPDSFGANTDAKTKMASLEINRELSEGLLLTYLGAYNDFDSHVVSSFFPRPVGNTDAPVPITNDQTNKSTSHELRLNVSSGRLEAVLGAYYFWNKSFYSVLALPATLRFMTAKSDGEAVFGQATYSVLDNLRLTGGLRYSHTKKSLDGANANPTTGLSRPFLGSETENRVDWRAGAEFDVGAGSMAYVNVQTGFTPGGFSAATASFASTQATSFDTIKLLAYSAGIKNRLLDNKLTLNLEGFYYDYKNYQVSARDPATLQVNVYNSEKARVYGGQVDIDFKITPDDRLTLGVVHVNAEATRLTIPNPAPGPGGVPITNLDGFTLPYAPKWTVNASYEHIFPLASGGQVEALANTQFSSGQWLIYSHAPNTYMRSKIRTDLTLTYRPEGNRWSIAAWVRNVENSVVRLFGAAPAINAPPFPALFSLDSPRTYGGRLTFNF